MQAGRQAGRQADGSGALGLERRCALGAVDERSGELQDRDVAASDARQRLCDGHAAASTAAQAYPDRAVGARSADAHGHASVRSEVSTALPAKGRGDQRGAEREGNAEPWGAAAGFCAHPLWAVWSAYSRGLCGSCRSTVSISSCGQMRYHE
jgi:hypothetical protein